MVSANPADAVLAGDVATDGETDQKQRNTAALVNVAGLFFPLFAPLIGYFVVSRKDSPWAHARIRDTLNFAISMCICYVVLAIISMTVILAIPAMIADVVLMMVFLVTQIRAAVAGSRGRAFRFPLSIRLIG